MGERSKEVRPRLGLSLSLLYSHSYNPLKHRSTLRAEKCKVPNVQANRVTLTIYGGMGVVRAEYIYEVRPI